MQIDGRNVAASPNHSLDVAVQADLATKMCIRTSGYNLEYKYFQANASMH